MKIVYSIFIFCFLLTGISTFAQTDVAAARLTAEKYLEATEAADWEAVADLLYPKLFEISPREQIISSFEEMQNDPDLQFKIYDMRIDSQSKIQHHGEEKFTLLNYSMKMEMLLKGEDYQDEGAVELILGQMKGVYGEEKVRYDEAANTIHIQTSSTMIGLSPIDGNDWKFIDYKPGLEQMLGDLFAEGLWERIQAAMTNE